MHTRNSKFSQMGAKIIVLYLFWCPVPEFDQLLFSTTFVVSIIVDHLALGARYVVDL